VPKASALLSPPKGLDSPITCPFTRLDRGTWLHDRPETDVYRLLIDAYRMRCEDDYAFGGGADEDSIYSGAADGLAGFRRFLARTAGRPGLLPPWWSPAKQKECEHLGMQRGDDNWHDLSCAIEKKDVIEHYGEPRFPMQLRMFAEFVCGPLPGGAGNGDAMRKHMSMMELGSYDGEVAATTIDTTTWNSSAVFGQ
jgi:splicing suppressor protein 51